MITGLKVQLRPVSLEDYKRNYEWQNDEETAKLVAGSGFYLCNNVPFEKFEDDYEHVIKKLDKREIGKFSIYTLGEKPEHIGGIEYREINIISRSCTVGIGIGIKEYWGKGYGTDAMKTLIHFLFQTMNLQRIKLETWSGNIQAIRSYEKCGFVVEGRLRKDEYIDGKYYDTVIMGLLKEEFQY
ncbi:putative acetyltransferase [Bacillus sp. TS-2]|nr:putative acetyltransferase [Bacillus sp. TS-2]